MNLWVVGLLRKGPIGGNNCHNLPVFATKGDHPTPEGGGGDVVGSPVVVLPVAGDSVVEPLVGGDEVVVAPVVDGAGVVLVTVGSDGCVLGALFSGRSTGPGLEFGRTMPPMVVPCPPETWCPVIHSTPVMASMPSANASTAPGPPGGSSR
jgi:hypothetical protein